MEELTVGQVASLTGVTIRTLHHYDRIGLLRPSGRSEAGYRRYGTLDLQRLQQALLYREFGFSLEDIAAILDNPKVDPMDHLRVQRELLRERSSRLEEMIAAIEFQMEAMKMGVELTPEERFEVFGTFDVEGTQTEAKERWGDTDAYKETAKRTSGYGVDEWRAIKAEAEEIDADFAAALDEGAPPDSERAMEIAERHRAHINRWFYPLDAEMHRALGEMYVSDHRFAQHFESRAEGLTAYVSEAIAARSRRA